MERDNSHFLVPSLVCFLSVPGLDTRFLLSLERLPHIQLAENTDRSFFYVQFSLKTASVVIWLHSEIVAAEPT